MKLGTQPQAKPKKLPPPRVGTLPSNSTETTTMSKDTSNAPATTTSDDDDEDEEGTKSNIPRAVRYAMILRNISGRFIKREAGKGVGMRQWVDNIAARVEDPEAKLKLAEIGDQLDATYKAVGTIADLFESLPEVLPRRGGSGQGREIDVGTVVRIADKFKNRYEGVLNSLTGLKVFSFRKGSVGISDESSGTRENYFVPATHIVAE